MDDYRRIEVEVAKKYGAVAKGTRKSLGDFLIDDDINRPVNVKSNNLGKNNYSPNIMSAKRLIKWWTGSPEREMFFLFINYRKTENGIEYVNDSGIIAAEHIKWSCLTIEAQGWGVIQMCKPLELDKTQDKKMFLSGMKLAYEKYMGKEEAKMAKIREMIKDF